MSAEKIDELLMHAEELPDGREKLAMVEEAVRLADSINDLDRAYAARIEVVQSATHCDLHDRAFVAFSWCIAHHDRMEGAVEPYELLWYFKWVLAHTPGVLSITTDQIFALEDDMARRLEAAGFNQRPIEGLRYTNRAMMGLYDEARPHYEEFKATGRDAMSDCRACELDTEVDYRILIGRDDRAIQSGKRLISGELGSCATVPQHTYGRIIRPLMRLDRMEEARELHEAGFPQLTGQPEYIRHMGDHLVYMIRTGQLDKAVTTLEKSLPFVVDIADANTQVHLYDGIGLTLEAIAETSDGPRRFAIPDQLAAHRPDHTYDPAELSAWFLGEADRLATALDSRNGTDRYQAWRTESRELAGLG